MAVDMYLRLDGIKGEAQDSKHKGEIDILSWSWGVQQSGTMHQGGGGGSGKASFHDLTVTKYVDKSTPLLFTACATGEHISKGNLVVRKAGKVQHEYIKIELTDCLISSISTGGSGGEDRLTESISINFGHVTVDYLPQKADGSLEGTVTFKYNIAQNTV